MDTEELYSEVMVAYKPECRYLRNCRIDENSIEGGLSLHECCYLEPGCRKTHLYVSELVIIYEQMLSVYLADFFINKKSMVTPETFFEQVLEQRLFAAKVDMRFKAQIVNAEFSGRLESELRADRRGRYTFVKTLTLDEGKQAAVGHFIVDLRGVDQLLSPPAVQGSHANGGS